MKTKYKNTKQDSISLVKEILKFSPEWDSLTLIVKLGKQDDNQYLRFR
jgi:hypothetical protein